MAKNDKKTTDDAPTDAAPEVATAEAATAPADAPATPEAKKPKAESTEGLVKMHKDGEHLYVHPLTVDAHKAAGWSHA